MSQNADYISRSSGNVQSVLDVLSQYNHEIQLADDMADDPAMWASLPAARAVGLALSALTTAVEAERNSQWADALSKQTVQRWSKSGYQP